MDDRPTREHRGKRVAQQLSTLSCVPSDTKSLHRSNSSTNIVARMANFMRSFLNLSFFPGDFEGAKSIKNYCSDQNCCILDLFCSFTGVG